MELAAVRGHVCSGQIFILMWPSATYDGGRGVGVGVWGAVGSPRGHTCFPGVYSQTPWRIYFTPAASPECVPNDVSKEDRVFPQHLRGDTIQSGFPMRIVGFPSIFAGIRFKAVSHVFGGSVPHPRKGGES